MFNALYYDSEIKKKKKNLSSITAGGTYSMLRCLLYSSFSIVRRNRPKLMSAGGDNTVDPVIKPKSLFNTDAVLCYEVALLKEVANHCVLEGGAAHLYTNTSVLSQDAVSDEPFQNMKKNKTC